MPFRLPLLAATLSLAASAALAGDIRIKDAYARATSSNAVSGAAFMALFNDAATEDRLIAVRGDIAERIELHTHLEDANAVMRMVKVEDGIVVPAGGMAMLERGRDHVMLMGLTRPLENGDTVTLTLIFEQAGAVDIDVPVDLDRKPGQNHGG